MRGPFSLGKQWAFHIYVSFRALFSDNLGLPLKSRTSVTSQTCGFFLGALRNVTSISLAACRWTPESRIPLGKHRDLSRINEDMLRIYLIWFNQQYYDMGIMRLFENAVYTWKIAILTRKVRTDQRIWGQPWQPNNPLLHRHLCWSNWARIGSPKIPKGLIIPVSGMDQRS